MTAQYPSRPLINPQRRYKRGVVAAVKRFKQAGPWRGTLEHRQQKFEALHRDLCTIYGIDVTLHFWRISQHCQSGNGFADIARRNITLIGKLSVVTLLHEWAHILHGSSEHTAVSWSVSLFARVWPRSAQRMMTNATDHTLRGN